MSLPDYSEFVSTLTQEKFEEIAERINNKKVEVDFSLSSEGLNSLFTASTALSINATLDIVKLYHEWLSKQLP